MQLGAVVDVCVEAGVVEEEDEGEAVAISVVVVLVTAFGDGF